MRLLVLFFMMLTLAQFARGAEPTKVEIDMTRDIKYRDDKDADKTRHLLDVYMPKGKKGVPVLFFVHGGSWQFGNKVVFTEPAKRLCEAGIGVVSVNYRLSPKVKHPAHVEDVAKAFAWTVGHIGEYGGSAKNMVVMGHSAGGHLVTLLSSDEQYLKAEKLGFANIKGTIGVSGVYTITHQVKLFHPVFGEEAEICKAASPLEHVGENLPPMLLIYGDKDLASLGKQAENLATALTKAKSEAKAKEYKDRTHATILSNMKTADDDVLKDVKEFILKQTK